MEKEVCDEVEMQQCQVKYQRSCQKVPEEKCETKYKQDCQTVYKGEKCRPGPSVKKCHTVSQEKVKYKAVKPKCVWPEKPTSTVC